MTETMDRWSALIDRATDAQERQQLLAEVSAWRAAHLTDIPSQREAAFAMSRLYMLLGQRDAAVREARTLVYLCETPPEAGGEERMAARAWLGSLGEAVPAIGTPSSAMKRKKKPRQRREGGERDLRSELSELRGKRGPKARLARLTVQLQLALEKDDAGLRADVESLVQGLLPSEQRNEIRREQDEPQGERRITREEQDLAALLGREIPRKLQLRIRALENHLTEHPADADKVASLALRHHVALSGLRKPAPWLVGMVGRALATSAGADTRAALNELGRRGSYAVSAYEEWPFEILVSLLATAEPQGWDLTAMRRGVDRKHESDDRRLWTARLVKDFDERMLVVAPPHDEPLPKVRRLAERVGSLCDKLVLLAPGAGNAALREALGARAVSVHEEADHAALLAALEAATPIQPAPAPDPSAAGAEASGSGGAEPAAAEPEAPRPPSPARALRTALEAGEDLLPHLQRFRRIHQAFAGVRDYLAGLEPAEADTTVTTLLSAMDQVAPEGVHLPEGTTLLVRTAASKPGGQTEAMLLSETRYTGGGAAEVLGLTRAAVESGWSVDRVHRGPTGRERRQQPALQTIGEEARGLWRVVLSKGEASGELWFLADMPPEGRAAVPLLLLPERNLAVVLPLDPDLLSWYRELGGPAAVGWTGEETPEVLEALGAWAADSGQQPADT